MTQRARKFSLRSILFADLAGYSRMVSLDEVGTLNFMQRAFDIFAGSTEEFGGKLIKTTGDGVVVDFTSASQSVTYAMVVQSQLAKLVREAGFESGFRIGIHLGEVERTENDLYGHAVNIAARLEAEAQPGGVCVSHEVYQHARRGTQYEFISEGVRPLKNIPDAVAVYHVIDREREVASGELARLEIATLDGLELRVASGETANINSNHILALLGYLALTPEYSEGSGRITALLWPDKEPASARRSMAKCLRTAQESVDELVPDVLVRRGNKVGLDVARTEVDLVTLFNKVSAGDVSDILIERPDWPEAILFGLDDVSQLFASWLRVTRHNWRTRFIERLEACLLRFDAIEVAARRAAMALLTIEPSHERALQKLLQHHAASGNNALAIKTFRSFSALVGETYGIMPSAETMAIVDGLKGSSPSDSTNLPTQERILQRPRVVIGGFNAGQTDSVYTHLVAGFRSEIISNLSKFRDWVVIEVEDENLTEVARESDFVMTAVCEKDHFQLIIKVILKEAGSRRVVWSERFEVSLEKWFDVQRQLVKRIAAHAEVYLSSDRLAQAIGTDSVNVSDYGDWLRGEHLLSLWTREDEDEAEQIFKSIIDRNPSFASAHASLASIYNVRHLIRPGSKRDAADKQKALPHALKAVHLDALDARNQQVIAWSAAMGGRYEQAAMHYELAVNLNGSSPKALLSCAQGLAFLGVKDRAKHLLDQAIDLAPFFVPHQWCYVASTNYMLGEYEAAVDAGRRGGHATMDNPAWKAAALSRLGRMNEAVEAFKEEIELVRSEWAGEFEPSSDDVLDWFVDAFPIGEKTERRELSDTMQSIVAQI